MPSNHWSAYHALWKRLGPPLRPTEEVVEGIRRELGENAGTTLLLGVTPELADIAPHVTAVDRSERMIAGVWPGDTPARRAVRANWFELPFGAGSFVAAVGDGALNVVPYPDGHTALHAEVARVLEPGGRAVIRAFCRPMDCESPEAVSAQAVLRRIDTFHAFKWRYAMALAAAGGNPSVTVREIHGAFTGRFGDRDELATRTGWDREDIDTIDVYRDSDEVYSFPTREEFLAPLPPSFARAEFVDAGTYELSERCPLLVLDSRG